jgi:hypothetical protein
MHKGRDQALIAWTKNTRRFLRIDLSSRSLWGNPFISPDDGDHDEVVDKFATYYLPFKGALLTQISAGALRGKVLGCWCHRPPAAPRRNRR